MPSAIGTKVELRAIILVAEKMDYKYVLVALYFIDNISRSSYYR